jgi:preprotein translocase subunit SecE
VAKKSNKTPRRIKRSELVAPKAKTSRKIATAARRQRQRAWALTSRTFGRSFSLPAPKGKAGKVLSKRVRGPKYFRESWQELKKVTWPTRKEAWRLTWSVFIFSAFFAIFTALADFGLSKAVERILLK